MTESDYKSMAQQRFGDYAERYLQSSTHAQAPELLRLLQLAQPQPGDVVLDIATGGGHTARTFAPHAQSVVAADLAPRMLMAARKHITENCLTNVSYTATDAEKLAFASASFDIVTCRIAPHHFPDIYRFVLECARVLKPGGRLMIQDGVTPEDERAARYIDSFERLRDPSHARTSSESEWRGTFLDCDLVVDHTEFARNTAKLVPWAKVQDNDDATIERLQILLGQAPDVVRDWLRPSCIGTADAEFDHVYLLILGHKPAAES
jgi:ubiquinone/menaquinone biosynthesis C-methylase UbiE